MTDHTDNPTAAERNNAAIAGLCERVDQVAEIAVTVRCLTALHRRIMPDAPGRVELLRCIERTIHAVQDGWRHVQNVTFVDLAAEFDGGRESSVGDARI